MPDVEKGLESQSVGQLLTRSAHVIAAMEALKQEKEATDAALLVALESYIGTDRTLPVLKARSSWYINEAGTVRSFVDFNDNYIQMVIPSGHHSVHASPDAQRGDFVLAPADFSLPHEYARAVLIKVSNSGMELFQDVDSNSSGEVGITQSIAGAMALQGAALSAPALESRQ